MKTLYILFFLLIGTSLCAQAPYFPGENQLFDDEVVPRIDIELSPNHLAQIYINVLSNNEFPATFTFTKGDLVETVENVGFRLRGNTSRFSDKKSFKVSFNANESGQTYRGVEKLNLNGEHNDPAIARSKICWDWAEELSIPAPRANHVELYINGDYYGLYVNVEHIDEEFVNKRFYNKDGNLFKCKWPVNLNWLGTDANAYKGQGYELKTNTDEDDWSGFVNFVDVLNNSSDDDFECALEEVFNIDAYLKILVFEILIAHWDGPLLNQNNFYLYHNTRTGKFEYIPFDLDNTLGVDFFGQNGFADIDIYDYESDTYDFPLYQRIMGNSKYRDQFTVYFTNLLTNFDESEYFGYLDAMRDRIEGFVEEDAYHSQDYEFDYDDFYDSFDEGISGGPASHVPLGIKEYFEIRVSSASEQLESADTKPVVNYVELNPALSNDPLKINAVVEYDTEPVFLFYEFNGVSETLEMSFNDYEQVYSIEIPPLEENGTFSYQIQAGETVEPCDLVEWTVDEAVFNLHINEFMAENQSVIADESGEFDDWIELYNGGSGSIYLGNKFLTDNWDKPQKWAFPEISIDAGSFLLIWADGETEEGPLHANFKLNSDGEEIGIFDANGDPIDLIRYNHQSEDQSEGYFPNGDGMSRGLEMPSPEATNSSALSIRSIEQRPVNDFELYPNPASQMVCFGEEPSNNLVQEQTFEILNMQGKVLHTSNETCWDLETPNGRIANGFYIVKLVGQTKTAKLIVVE